MLKPKLGLVSTALVAGALALSAISGSAIAKPKGVGVSGTYNCYCFFGTGGCTMIAEGDRVRCGRTSSNACNGSCRLDTTTSGVKGGAIKAQ